MPQVPKDDTIKTAREKLPGNKRVASGKPRAPQPPRLSVGNGYSFFVGTLKVVLPAVLAAMILLILAWPRIAPEDSGFRMGIDDLGPDDADTLTMVNPRYQGRDEQNRPFTVTAQEAQQARSSPGAVALERPQADITLKDDGWLALEAREGHYQREAQHLSLSRNVSLFHDHGFEMHTEKAEIDLKAGRAESDTAVTGQGPTGTIAAEGFRVEDKGERIFFTGKSRLVFDPDAHSGESATDGSAGSGEEGQ